MSLVGEGRTGGACIDTCPFPHGLTLWPLARESHTALSMPLPYETIYARIRRVPEGFVTTYGDLSPGAPRHAGRALSQMPENVPWWRVVHSDGTWPKGAEQRARLLAEDVPIRGSRVVMGEARIAPEAIR